MKSGRRNLKQGALEGCPEPQPGEALMRVVSLRGSNIFEGTEKTVVDRSPMIPDSRNSRLLTLPSVEDSDGRRTLCMLPAKFRKSLWIKTGNFLLVEEGDREKAAGAGNKVTGTIVQVLYDEHVRALRKTSFWPASFLDVTERPAVACATVVPAKDVKASNTLDSDDTESADEEDGLSPLMTNMNRQQHSGNLRSSGSDSDSDEDEQ